MAGDLLPEIRKRVKAAGTKVVCWTTTRPARRLSTMLLC
jgi:hypothetical protein